MGIRLGLPNLSMSPRPASTTALGVSLDAPISSTLAAKGLKAYSSFRVVEDYTGNVLQLERADSATLDVATLSDGRIDDSTVATWAGGTDVVVAKAYDQMGSADALEFPDKPLYMTGGQRTRFGTDWDSDTGVLTRSTTNGMPGWRFDGSANYGEKALTVDASNGLEFHILYSPDKRKIPNNITEPAALNGHSTAEAVFSYSTAADNYFQMLIGNGSNCHYIERNGTGAGGGSQALTSGTVIKQNSVNVVSVLCDNSDLSYYANARRASNAATSAGNITANGSFSNGTLRVGRASGSGTSYADMMVGAIIITETLTVDERFDLQQKLSLMAEEHLAMSDADFLSMINPTGAAIWDWSQYTNPTTGAIDDRNNNASFSWNEDDLDEQSFTAVTKANPAVMTCVGHGRNTGDKIYIPSGGDMVELDELVTTITRIDPDTFSLDGIDSTSYTTYTTGGTFRLRRNVDFAYMEPIWGLQGARTIGIGNYANAWIASNNYLADKTKFTLISIVYRQEAGGLAWWMSDGDVAGWPKDAGGTNSRHSRMSGYHHSQPCGGSRVNNGVDTSNITSNPPWSDDAYGKISQALGKYTGYMCPNGGVDKRDAIAITGVSNTNPVVVTAPGHGRSTNNRVALADIGGTTELNDTHHLVTVLTADTFELQGVDGTSMGVYTSGGNVHYCVDSAGGYTFLGNSFPQGYPCTWATANSNFGGEPATPEQRTYHEWTRNYPLSSNYLELIISTFYEGDNFDIEDQNTWRTGDRQNFVAPLFGKPIGHLDMSIATQIGNASVAYAHPDNRLQSHPYLEMPGGVKFLQLAIPDVVFDLEMAKKFQLNISRFLRNGWSDVAPAFTGTPVITGTQEVDRTLSVDITGLFSGSPTPQATFNLQQDNGGDLNFSTIESQVGGLVANHLLVDSEEGDKFRWYIQLHSVAGYDDIYTDPTGLIGASTAPPSNTVAPTLSGTMRGGESITVGNGTWIGAPTITYTPSLEYADTPDAAEEDWNSISGSGSPYVIPSDNTYQGKYFRPSVDGANAYGTVTAKGAAYGPIAAALSIPEATSRWLFNEAWDGGAGDTVNVAQDSKAANVDLTFDAFPLAAGAGVYANVAGGADTGYTTPSGSYYADAPWTEILWFQFNALPSVTSDITALGSGASSTNGNNSMRAQWNVGASQLDFIVLDTDGPPTAHTLSVTGFSAALSTSAKTMVALRYDGTGGNGATVMKVDIFKEGVGLVGSGTKTDADPMRTNAAYMRGDRRNNNGGLGTNAKWYSKSIHNTVLTDQEILDAFTAGSESEVY